MRFDFSCMRLYGFSSWLCPRQVLGFSALCSTSSWIFLAKLVEGLTKNKENQDQKEQPKTCPKLAKKFQKSSKNHRKSTPDPPQNRGQEALERSSKAGSYPYPLLGRTAEVFGTYRRSFWRPFGGLGPQDGSMLEAKTEPKSIKNRCEKG